MDGTLTTFGCVQWESELFLGVMRPFKLPKLRFHDVNQQVYMVVYTIIYCTYMYMPVRTGMYQYIPVHTATSTYLYIPVRTSMYWYVLVYGTYMYIPVCTGMYLYIPVHTGFSGAGAVNSSSRARYTDRNTTYRIDTQKFCMIHTLYLGSVLSQCSWKVCEKYDWPIALIPSFSLPTWTTVRHATPSFPSGRVRSSF